MLRNSFQFLPNLGPAREAKLWKNGLRNWEDLSGALRSGIPLRRLLSNPDWENSESVPANAPDTRALTWIEVLDQARQALEGGNLNWFLERLPGSEHWRVLAGRIEAGLYLDIETNGGGPSRHNLTVLGILFEGEFRQWVWPEDMTAVNALIQRAPFVGSFAGRSFDVPFLRRSVPGFPMPRAHIDLLSLARKARIRGGLKGVESYYGLQREEDVLGLRGAHAVDLWQQAQRGDARALDLLLRYNRADVEMLPRIGEKLCQEIWQSSLLSTLAPELWLQMETRAPVRDLEWRVVREDGGAPSEPWIQRESRRARESLGRDPIVVAVVSSCWSRLRKDQCWTSRFRKSQDALFLAQAAKPDLVVLDEEYSELVQPLEESGQKVLRLSLDAARASLPGKDLPARELLLQLRVRSLETKSEDELSAICLALAGLLQY